LWRDARGANYSTDKKVSILYRYRKRTENRNRKNILRKERKKNEGSWDHEGECNTSTGKRGHISASIFSGIIKGKYFDDKEDYNT
jgi:hypothetical protein